MKKTNYVKGLLTKDIIAIISLIIVMVIVVGIHVYFGSKNDFYWSLNIMAGSLNGRFSTKISKRLKVISVLINNVCNLKCKHCYLQAEKFGKYLMPEEWSAFFNSVYKNLAPDTLCFAGKEVFFNTESSQIFFNAIEQRNHFQQGLDETTQIGVITNGTLLESYKKAIIQTPPDYFDISIDGLPEQHNYIRGKGAFEKTSANLHWLRDNFNGNIWITHTILGNNFSDLTGFILYISKTLRIFKFSIGIYKEKPYTDLSFTISQSEVYHLFNKTLAMLANLKLDSPTEVIIEIDYTQREYMPILLESGWTKDNELFTSCSQTYDNGLKLTINVAHIPVGLWRSIRVTPEGYWLAAEDLMEVRDYPEYSVANLREYNFNAQLLYQAGIKSYRFKELQQSVALSHSLFDNFYH